MITNHDVTYTVLPGKPLKVWEGKTASQELDDSVKGTKYWLEGGVTQIVLDPKHLEMSFFGKRQSTGWGYTDFGTPTDHHVRFHGGGDCTTCSTRAARSSICGRARCKSPSRRNAR